MKSSVLIPAAIRGRYSDNGSIVQRLELRPDKCTNTLTSVQKDNIMWNAALISVSPLNGVKM